MEDLSGQSIRGYQLLEYIESGGFGSVYRAHQAVVEREVAVKIIRPDHANRPDFIRAFETEARLVARLEHPFILPLYDFWREPAGAYLVMRWMPGGSLLDAIYRQSWQLGSVARLLDQIGSALALAHGNGVVHQDIKPANILLDAEGNAYLTDFGIAKDLTNPASSVNSIRYGSPAYMSPEQVQRHAVTPAADLYSLGIVLFQMLTGDLPYDDDDNEVILKHHLDSAIPSLEDFRSGLPYEFNLVINRAMAKDPRDRFPDAVAMAQAFREIVTRTGASLGSMDIPTAGGAVVLQGTIPLHIVENEEHTIELESPIEPNNPYKGLQPFDEADHSTFFGREMFTSRLLRHLSHDDGVRFLAVVGPSGSGKSSAVKAGLLPALRQGQLAGSSLWFITAMTPGANPFDELATALLQVATRAPEDLTEQLRRDDQGLYQALGQLADSDETEFVLVIDQFEELFTLVESENERALFLDSLTNAVHADDSRLRIIITLRADFYDRPLLYPVFGQLIHEHTQVILPMTATELEAAIRGPADRADLVLDTALIKSMVDDIHSQPGALPLLQFALTELFERRSDHRLAAHAYQDIGGISGALAKRADEIYDSLDTDHQQMAQQLFLRLVAVGDVADDTRRRVHLTELQALGDNVLMQDTIDVFAKYRLLTLDRDPTTRLPTVEVAHEALIREWSRLREWLDANRSDLRLQRQLASNTAGWLAAGRDTSFVATGIRQAQFEVLLTAGNLALSSDEQAYVQAGIALRERIVLRRRLLIAGLTLVAIAALVLAFFAITQQRRAEQQARVALSRQLAVTSLGTLDEQADLALLLSLEALRINDSFETRSGLLTALQQHPNMAYMLHETPGQIRAVAVSPDGRWLAAGGTDAVIDLWDVTTGTHINDDLAGHIDSINSIAISPDGTQLASGSIDDTIILWNIETLTPVGSPLVGHNDDVWHVAFSPDGQTLIAAGGDGIITRWDVATQTLIDTLNSHDGIVYSAVYNAAGDVIASGGDDDLIRLWDAVTGAQISEPLAGHTNWVLDVAFSPDGTLLASGSADQTIILWDVARQQPVAALSGHDNWVWSVAFSHDGTRLASGSADHTTMLWDIETMQPIGQPYSAHLDDVREIIFTPDDTLLFSGGLDTRLLAWDVAQQDTLQTLFAQQGEPVSDVVVSPDGQLIISAEGDPSGVGESNAIHVWDAATDHLLRSFTQHQASVLAIDLDSSGLLLASASVDGTVQLSDVVTGNQIGVSLIAHNEPVTDVSFNDDDTLLASAGFDGTVRLWDVVSQTQIGDPLQHVDQVMGVTFSPDGTRLASAVWDTTVHVWDVTTTPPTDQVLNGHTDVVLDAVFSPDSAVLATTGRDNTIILWDVATGSMIGQPMTGHSNFVFDLAFSPDGTLLASASQDNTIILWDVASRRPLGQSLRIHNDWVNAVTFSPDGQYLLSGSGGSRNLDSSIYKLSLDVDAWQAHACAVANRNLTDDEWTQFVGNDDSPRVMCLP